jgi:uncharacterized membrane protein YgdD (TMEM256/DUF423 family)
VSGCTCGGSELDFPISTPEDLPDDDRVMSNKLAIRTAAFLGLMAVALGAFGAHALKATLAANQTTAIWEKAVFYHFIHTVMLFVLASRTRFMRGPWFAFLAGILIFSGTLYALALTNLKWLGAITPLGGLSFMIGWIWLIVAAPGFFEDRR